MTIHFKKGDSERGTFSIDLTRDLEALTQPFDQMERFDITRGLVTLIENANSREDIVFNSALELETALRETPLNFCKTFERFVNHAERFEDHIVEIYEAPDGGLFYDYEPFKDQDTSSTLLRDGIDLYVGLKTSMKVDTGESFDFSEIPHAILNGAESHPLFQPSSEDEIFIMHCLDKITFTDDQRKNEIKDIVQNVIDLNTQNHDCPLRGNVSENILAMFDLIDSMTAHCQLEPTQILDLITKAAALYDRQLVEMNSQTFLKRAGVAVEKYKDSKDRVHDQRQALSQAQPSLTRDSFYNNLAERLFNAGSTIDLLEPHFPNVETCQTQTIETIFKFNYLPTNELKKVIQKLEIHNVDIIAELDILCGLNFDDIMTAIDRSFDDSFISGHHLHDSFNHYFHENHDNKFIPHQEYAAQTIEKYNLTGITPEMVSLIIMIESEGEKNKENPAGTHLGLMQVGRLAYEQITKKDLSLEDLKNTITGHPGWQQNIEVGTRYLSWSLRNYNPVQSLAIAKGNFNYGSAGMLKYRMPHMYEIGNAYTLNGETADYIAKYLVYRRWLHAAS